MQNADTAVACTGAALPQNVKEGILEAPSYYIYPGIDLDSYVWTDCPEARCLYKGYSTSVSCHLAVP